MNDVIELRKGHGYFYCGFLDPELSVPKIETVTYQGPRRRRILSVRDAASHVAHLQGEDHSEGYRISFAEDRIDGILDRAHLIEWLKQEHLLEAGVQNPRERTRVPDPNRSRVELPPGRVFRSILVRAADTFAV